MQSLLCFVFVVAVATDEVVGFEKRGYIVTSPAVFRAAVNHRIKVRIFNHADSVRVNANLVDHRENLVASDSQEITESGFLNLKIPAGAEGRATLKICGNCYLSTGFKFVNQSAVTVVNKGSSAFVQTDKPVYKPSQTVFVTIFTVDRDLKPLTQNMTAYLVGPDDVRIMKWKNVRPICCGVVNFSFPLSDQPALGTWKISVDLNGQTYDKTFQIRKYVLPKFEVAITPPPYFRTECEEVRVEAGYVFGKPVVGTLFVNMSLDLVDAGGARSRDMPVVLRTMQINRTSTFQACLSDLLPEGISRQYDGHLRINAHVVASDGTEFSAHDNTTPVSRRNVDIEFSVDTRGHFKPGMDFAGKIKCKFVDGTRARGVTLDLIVHLNDANFFRKYLTSDSRGEADFVIPALPPSAKKVSIEAVVVAIRGDLVPTDDYVSIFKDVFGWNSPSGCYLQAEGPTKLITPGSRAKVHVHSSCGCNFALYYELMSRGNAVLSGRKLVDPRNSKLSRRASYRTRRSSSPHSFHDQPNRFPDPSRREVVGSNRTCRTSFFIDVTPEMAPLSRLLVYYVRPDGEGVADSIHMPVAAQLRNKMSVTASKTSAKPGSDVTVHVEARASSCVCVALIDRSVHLMRPGYLLTKEEIFEELHDYDLTNAPADHGWGSRLLWETRDAKFAFLETGLVVMTDAVALDHRETVQLFSSRDRQALTQVVTSPHDVGPRRRLRSYFPETWVWQCFTMPADSTWRNVTIRVPDSITTWQADAFSLHPERGIGIADSTRLRSFKNFFVDFTLPYSVIRGEQVQVQLNAYNYMNTCAQVRIQVMLPEGITFRRQGNNRMERHVCVDAQTSSTINVTLQFNLLGSKRIRASGDAIVGETSCCHGDRAPSIVATDLISRKVLVEAEGLKREYTNSVFFCPNERINITTTSDFAFHFERLPSDATGFDFLVRAPRNVHLVLADSARRTDRSYEVVLGDEGRSWIARGTERLVTAATDHILSEDEFRAFWISWKGGDIQVGRGRDQGRVDSRFMQWREPEAGVTTHEVVYVGFATEAGASGEFKLWNRQDSQGNEDGFFMLSLPPNAIHDSVRAKATLIGDVMGPTLKNLNNLLSMPFGCGEQNMANFAPNIYVLKYLGTTKQLTDQVRAEAMHYLQTGYQRQLTYKRRDKSFSAFGNRDSSGSMWLTSFVLKSFSQAREFIYVDPNQLHEAKEWILSWQRHDGSFPAVGKIWNKDTQGGNQSDVTLTAYVTIALIESGSNVEDLVVMRAKEFLENHVRENRSPYTAALLAYSLTLAHSSYADRAREMLYDMATLSKNEMYWKLATAGEAGEQFVVLYDGAVKQTVVSAEVEMTSYALLTYTHRGNITSALPIVKWLSKMRNALGGFSSTQDTCAALQALSEYARLSFIGGPDLSVELQPTNRDGALTFELNSANSDVLQTLQLQVPTTMFVIARGDGCALLQVDVTYNIPNPESHSAFDISVKVKPSVAAPVSSIGGGGMVERSVEGRFDMEACVRWLHHASSNMAVLEFHLLTGLRADLESLQSLLEEQQMYLKRYEVNGRAIFFYFDEIPSTCKICVRFAAVRQQLTAQVASQVVRVYDYYEPVYEAQFVYRPPASMLTADCDNSSDSCHQQQEENPTVEAECVGCDDEFGECRCSHDCGFQGPQVCGSNQVLYLNRCRLEAAACELGRNISEEKLVTCQTARAPPTPTPTHGDLFPPNPLTDYGEKTYDQYDYGEGNNILSDQPIQFPMTEDENTEMLESTWKKFDEAQ